MPIFHLKKCSNRLKINGAKESGHKMSKRNILSLLASIGKKC